MSEDFLLLLIDSTFIFLPDVYSDTLWTGMFTDNPRDAAAGERLPKESLSRQPHVVLLDGLQGEEQQQQQHWDTEDRSTPTAHQGAKTTEAMSHQDAVAHAEREGWGWE